MKKATFEQGPLDDSTALSSGFILEMFHTDQFDNPITSDQESFSKLNKLSTLGSLKSLKFSVHKLLKIMCPLFREKILENLDRKRAACGHGV